MKSGRGSMLINYQNFQLGHFEIDCPVCRLRTTVLRICSSTLAAETQRQVVRCYLSMSTEATGFRLHKQSLPPRNRKELDSGSSSSSRAFSAACIAYPASSLELGVGCFCGCFWSSSLFAGDLIREICSVRVGLRQKSFDPIWVFRPYNFVDSSARRTLQDEQRRAPFQALEIRALDSRCGRKCESGVHRIYSDAVLRYSFVREPVSERTVRDAMERTGHNVRCMS